MIRRERAGVVSVGFDLRRCVADVKLVMKVVTYFSHEGIAWMAARHDEVAVSAVSVVLIAQT